MTVPVGALDNAFFVTPVDALGLPGALVAVPLEVKNVHDWLYPRAPEVHQVLSKAAQLQLARPTMPIVPVLIARRIHTTTFRMFKDLGALGQQTKRQYIGAFDYTVICEEPDVSAEVGCWTPSNCPSGG